MKKTICVSPSPLAETKDMMKDGGFTESVPGGHQELGAPTWGELFTDFTQQTTLHGVRYVSGTVIFMARRVLWLLLLLFCMGLFVYYAYNRVYTYLQYEVNINVEFKYKQSIEFPAVTICNTNTFKLSRAVRGGFYTDVKKLLEIQKAAQGVKECNAKEEFQCQLGECVRKSRMCDRFPDCSNEADELPENCDGQCWMICVDSFASSSESAIQLEGRCFAHDSFLQNLHNLSYPAYSSAAQTAEQEALYLYYNDHHSRWIFGRQISANYSSSNETDVFWETEQNTHVFAQPNEWSVAASQGVEDGNSSSSTEGKTATLVLSCLVVSVDEPLLEDLLGKLVASSDDVMEDATLFDLYNRTAPTLDDSLIRCSWKNDDCSMDSFTERYTDMGLCYTYEAPEPSDLPGPGYGLSMTFNIEQYDYTRDAGDGIGIKVLLHDVLDEPVMAQKSFAISPGLYTLISVERTEVNSLAAPWGTCVMEDLQYYDEYTMATCMLECENNVIREECGCRDVHMPGRGQEPVCSISTYIECGQMKLEQNRRFGNYCAECVMPCREVNYIPSISFSEISTNPENQGDDMKSLTVALTSKVAEAREYTYRLFPEKYRETLKMFNLVVSNIDSAHSYLQGALDAFTADLGEVRMRVAEVQTDCIWFTSGQNQLVQVLHDELLSAGVQYMHHAQTVLKSPLQDLQVAANLSYAEYELDNSTAEHWRSTISDGLLKLRDALDLTLHDKITTTEARISDAEAELEWRLWNSKLDPLLSYARVRCEQCAQYPGAILEGLSGQLLQVLNNSMIPDLQAMLEQLDAGDWESQLLPGSDWEFNATVTQGPFVEFLANVSTMVDHHVQMADEKMVEPVRTTARFAEDLMRLTAAKCGSELQRPLEGYLDSHTRMEIIFDVMLDELGTFDELFKKSTEAYEAVEKTLDEVAQAAALDDLVDDLQTNLLTLLGLLDVRKISQQRIGQYINVINYWFLAQTPSSELRANSKYWKSLKLTNPGFSNPSRRDPRLVAKSEQYVITDSILDKYWGGMAENLEKRRSEIKEAVYGFDKAVAPSRDYLQEYLKGNELEESFLGGNVLQLNIFYKELAERKVTQQKAYVYESLLGEVGGLMGLLLGASVMTLFEFADFIIFNGIIMCTRRKKVASQ